MSFDDVKDDTREGEIVTFAAPTMTELRRSAETIRPVPEKRTARALVTTVRQRLDWSRLPGLRPAHDVAVHGPEPLQRGLALRLPPRRQRLVHRGGGGAGAVVEARLEGLHALAAHAHGPAGALGGPLRAAAADRAAARAAVVARADHQHEGHLRVQYATAGGRSAGN